MDDLPSMIEAHAKPRSRVCRAVFDSPLRIVLAFALIVGGFCAADWLKDLFPNPARELIYLALCSLCLTPFMVFGCYALRCWPVWRYLLHMWLFGAVLALAEWCISVRGIALPNGYAARLILALVASAAAGVMTERVDRRLRRRKRVHLPAIVHD